MLVLNKKMLFFGFIVLIGNIVSSFRIDLLQEEGTICENANNFRGFPDKGESGGTCTNGGTFADCASSCDQNGQCDGIVWTEASTSCCLWINDVPELVSMQGSCTYFKTPDLVHEVETDESQIGVPTEEGECRTGILVSEHTGLYADLLNGLYEPTSILDNRRLLYMKNIDENRSVILHSFWLERNLAWMFELLDFTTSVEGELTALAAQFARSPNDATYWIIWEHVEGQVDPNVIEDYDMVVHCAPATECEPVDGFVSFADEGADTDVCTTGITFDECVSECTGKSDCDAFDWIDWVEDDGAPGSACCFWEGIEPDYLFIYPGGCTYIRIPDDIPLIETSSDSSDFDAISQVIATADGECIHGVLVTGHQGVYSTLINGFYVIVDMLPSGRLVYMKNSGQASADIQIYLVSSPQTDEEGNETFIWQILSLEGRDDPVQTTLAIQVGDTPDEITDWLIVLYTQGSEDSTLVPDATMKVQCATPDANDPIPECPHGIQISGHTGMYASTLNGEYLFMGFNRDSRAFYGKPISETVTQIIVSGPHESDPSLFVYVILTEDVAAGTLDYLAISVNAVEDIDDIWYWVVVQYDESGDLLTEANDFRMTVVCDNGGGVAADGPESPPHITPVPPFECDDGETSLLNFKVCDGVFDCEDKSDENPRTCGTITTAPIPCEDDEEWSSGFGGCSDYAEGGEQEGFCLFDENDEGVYAIDACKLSCDNCGDDSDSESPPSEDTEVSGCGTNAGCCTGSNDLCANIYVTLKSQDPGNRL